MAQSTARTVDDYLAELAPERRVAVEAVRGVIFDHLPDGYVENMQYGMISYDIPLQTLPDTYNGQPLTYAALASQKNYMSLYLMGVYGDPEVKIWFTERYKSSGKRMDIGKSCVRFRKLEDLPLDLVGEAVARIGMRDFIELYHTSRRGSRKGRVRHS